MSKTNTATRRVDSTIPAATLAQRLSSLTESQLMDVAKRLASDTTQDALCTAVLEELETRTRSSDAFHAFVSEIFA